MLADSDIEFARLHGRLEIVPFVPANLQPASVDLTLDRHFLVPKTGVSEIDMANVNPDHMAREVASNEGFVLEPGDFVLASTKERVRIGHDLVGRVEGKSSIGRLGLIVHVTAGFIDPGFEGQITLEMVNLAPWNIVVYPGQKICQIAFSQLSRTVLRPYGTRGNHYQGQEGPVPSRFEMTR